MDIETGKAIAEIAVGVGIAVFVACIGICFVLMIKDS